MIVLVEVGDTCIPQSFKEDVNNIGISWASEVNDILLSGKHIWLTEDEFKRYQSSKENS
jgi:hypothetical protein